MARKNDKKRKGKKTLAGPITLELPPTHAAADARGGVLCVRDTALLYKLLCAAVVHIVCTACGVRRRRDYYWTRFAGRAGRDGLTGGRTEGKPFSVRLGSHAPARAPGALPERVLHPLPPTLSPTGRRSPPSNARVRRHLHLHAYDEGRDEGKDFFRGDGK